MIFKERRIERRQYKRRNCYCLLKYRPFRRDKAYFETPASTAVISSLRNISGGGILFKSKEYLPVDCQLEMEINVPSIETIIKVLAKVVRFERIKGRRGYWAGVMFLDIKEDDRRKIIDFVASERKILSGRKH